MLKNLLMKGEEEVIEFYFKIVIYAQVEWKNLKIYVKICKPKNIQIHIQVSVFDLQVMKPLISQTVSYKCQ